MEYKVSAKGRYGVITHGKRVTIPMGVSATLSGQPVVLIPRVPEVSSLNPSVSLLPIKGTSGSIQVLLGSFVASPLSPRGVLTDVGHLSRDLSDADVEMLGSLCTSGTSNDADLGVVNAVQVASTGKVYAVGPGPDFTAVLRELPGDVSFVPAGDTPKDFTIQSWITNCKLTTNTFLQVSGALACFEMLSDNNNIEPTDGILMVSTDEAKRAIMAGIEGQNLPLKTFSTLSPRLLTALSKVSVGGNPMLPVLTTVYRQVFALVQNMSDSLQRAPFGGYFELVAIANEPPLRIFGIDHVLLGVDQMNPNPDCCLISTGSAPTNRETLSQWDQLAKSAESSSAFVKHVAGKFLETLLKTTPHVPRAGAAKYCYGLGFRSIDRELINGDERDVFALRIPNAAPLLLPGPQYNFLWAAARALSTNNWNITTTYMDCHNASHEAYLHGTIPQPGPTALLSQYTAGIVESIKIAPTDPLAKRGRNRRDYPRFVRRTAADMGAVVDLGIIHEGRKEGNEQTE